MRITTSHFGGYVSLNPLPPYTWSSTWPSPALQGWQCPLCQVVYAPTVPACNCAQRAQVSTATGTVVVSDTASANGLPKGTGITYTAKANGGGPEL